MHAAAGSGFSASIFNFYGRFILCAIYIIDTQNLFHPAWRETTQVASRSRRGHGSDVNRGYMGD
jgi:hypothetical protein